MDARDENDERSRPRSAEDLTYAQRMAEMAKMQQAFVQLLQESPELHAEFMARNFKKRAIDPDHPELNTSHGPIPPGPPEYR